MYICISVAWQICSALQPCRSPLHSSIRVLHLAAARPSVARLPLQIYLLLHFSSSERDLHRCAEGNIRGVKRPLRFLFLQVCLRRSTICNTALLRKETCIHLRNGEKGGKDQNDAFFVADLLPHICHLL